MTKHSSEDCAKVENTLSCFMEHSPFTTTKSYILISEHGHIAVDDKNDIILQRITFSSQEWPIDSGNIWMHRASFYIPNTVKHNTAFLYINGGTRYDKYSHKAHYQPKENLNYAKIADEEEMVVINLEDVPNQYITFEDGIARKEDYILAYTYRKFLDNPQENKYLLGHLPMAKAVVATMDRTTEFLERGKLYFGESYTTPNITDFIIAGASKRGWAAWLTAISDERVSALIPVAVDVLNVEKSINNICSVYKNGCPPVLKPYVDEDIFKNLNTENGKKLLQIEDPYSYINHSEFGHRMEIPKLIINMASDDFYTPDSSKFYFDELPGNNYLRYIPNSMHYFMGNNISDANNSADKINSAVQDFIHFQINNIELPEINWKLENNKIVIETSQIPNSITYWQAINYYEKDFRCVQPKGYMYEFFGNYYTFVTKSMMSYITNDLCDTAYVATPIAVKCESDAKCDIVVDNKHESPGFQAAFVDLEFLIDDRSFTLSTQVSVTGDESTLNWSVL